MNLITKYTDYAVQAMLYIAKKDGLVSTRELEENLNLPRPFIRKILLRLQQSGILISHKGSNGGFELAKESKKITLLEISEVFQGPFVLIECVLKNLPCPNRGRCSLRKRIKSIEKLARDEFKRTTLYDLTNCK